MTEKMRTRNIKIKREVLKRVNSGYTLQQAIWAVVDSDWCYLSYKQVERVYYETVIG